MPIAVSCECGGKFRARDELAGRTVKCPRCGNPLTVPNETYDVVEESPVHSAYGSVAASTYVSSSHSVAQPGVTLSHRSTAPGRSSRRPLREWLYLALALTLIPLLWSTFQAKEQTPEQRLIQTVKAHPEARDRVLQIVTQPHFTEDELFAALPNHRLDGALLEYGSKAHWLFALIGAVVFFGLALLMIPAATTKPLHVFYTGLFTGTAGVLLLLAVQFISSMMRGQIIIPRSIVGLIFLILKGIQLSYDAANNPDSNFFLSALGFTFGVGLCEELCKALPLLWHYRTRARLDWRGACLWGFLSGAGFGISEAIMYCGDYYNGSEGLQTYLVRFVSCVGLHSIWAAAAGIFIYKHQNLIQDAESWYTVLLNCAILVSVPMVLHGFYDTMLKKDMHAAALCVAVISFAWLVFQIEQAHRRDRAGGVPAYA